MKTIKFTDSEDNRVLFLRGSHYLVDVCESHTIIYNSDDFSSLRIIGTIDFINYCGENCYVSFKNGSRLAVCYNDDSRYKAPTWFTSKRFISFFNKKTVKALNSKNK